MAGIFDACETLHVVVGVVVASEAEELVVGEDVGLVVGLLLSTCSGGQGQQPGLAGCRLYSHRERTSIVVAARALAHFDQRIRGEVIWPGT